MAELLATPGVADLLRRERAADAAIWEGGAEETSLPRVAAACASALSCLAPRLLLAGEDAGGAAVDKQRLLSSFSERYDSLLAKHEELQARCRDIAEQAGDCERLRQETSAWQAAHSTATQRIEEVTLENGDLKESVRQLKGQGLGLEERTRLERLVAQREAEVIATGDALRQLQEVLEDGEGDSSARGDELEAQLRATRRELREAQAARVSDAEALRAAEAVAAGAAAREQALLERGSRDDAEVRESSIALESLLRDKERFLEEREYLVDRRFVTSALALSLEQLAEGKSGLTQQVLVQTLRALGGVPEEDRAQRQRLQTARRQSETAEPLGDAFLDFLTRELSDADDPAKAQQVNGTAAAKAPSAAAPGAV